MLARVPSVLRKAGLALSAVLVLQAATPASAFAGPFHAAPAFDGGAGLPLVQVRNGRNAAIFGGAIAGIALGAALANRGGGYAQPSYGYGGGYGGGYDYGAAPVYAPEPYAAPSYGYADPEPSYGYGGYAPVYGGDDGYYAEPAPVYRPRHRHYYEAQRRETFYRDPWGGPTTRLLPEGK